MPPGIEGIDLVVGSVPYREPAEQLVPCRNVIELRSHGAAPRPKCTLRAGRQACIVKIAFNLCFS